MMPAFFLELFSEEIPARMQSRAAEDLSRLIGEALATLSPTNIRAFHGPRRIALAADVFPGVAAASTIERGPRASAPEQALTGFLRKHNASRDQLRQEGDYWVLEKSAEAIPAATLIAEAVPAMLRRFPWPKSMRWGGSSNFTWVRPLRRITCLLDGAVVPFDLRDGADDGRITGLSKLARLLDVKSRDHPILDDGRIALAAYPHAGLGDVELETDSRGENTAAVGQHKHLVGNTLILGPRLHHEHIVHRGTGDYVDPLGLEVSGVRLKARQVLG